MAGTKKKLSVKERNMQKLKERFIEYGLSQISTNEKLEVIEFKTTDTMVLIKWSNDTNTEFGQNFFYTSTDNRQQSRFLPFQQNQFSTVQQPFANYFPQTNAGPFLPFRSSGYQINSDPNSAAITSPQKFQNSQQYSVSPYQLPEQTSDVVSDPRYDPLISSPGLFGGTNNDDYVETSFPDQLQPQSQLPEVPSQRFNSPGQQSPAPSQPERQSSHQQFRTNQLSSFSPVAISEVTRTQDAPNNPNGLQTHSFNVHHTPRHPADELPAQTSNSRWRSTASGHPNGADFVFRGRNIPAAVPPSSSPAAFQPYSTSRPVLPTAEPPGNTETSVSPFATKFNSRFGVAKEQTFIVNTQHPNVLELPEAQPDSDSTVKHYVPSGTYVPHQEKRKEFVTKSKNGGAAGRNVNIPPTTFSPPIILDNRIRNTLPTTDVAGNDPVPTTIRPQNWPRGSQRGRNKYSRPTTETSVERWPKNAKPKGGNGSKGAVAAGTEVLRQPTASAEDNSNFEVVTMSQDHLFVSEDNFKGFVDSASIDSTESPITDDIKDTSEGATVATVPGLGSGKRRPLPTVATPGVEAHEPRLTSTESTTERSHRKSSAGSTTSTARPSEAPSTSTEGWIIVASVQTSRSVSGARFIPSAAIKQEQHPLPLDSKSIKDLKSQHGGNKSHEHGATESTTTARTSSPKTSTVARSTSTLSTESIIDKLDQVQSDLSSGILSAFPSQDKSLMDMPGPTAASVRTTEPTSTTDSGEERFSRKFVPSSKTSPKPKADRKSLFDSIHFEDPVGLLPPGFKAHSFSPKNGGTSPRTTRVSDNRSTTATVASTTDSSSTAGEKSTSKNKTKSLSLASIKSKIKFDDVSQFLPPGYTPPPARESSSSEGSTGGRYHSRTTEATSAKLPDILNKAKPVDISSFLPPDFKLDSSAAASSPESSTKVQLLLSKISFKEANDLLPADFTTEAAKSSTSSTKLVFPSRPGGSKKPPTNTPKSIGKSSGLLPHQIPHIQKGWPTRATTEFAGWPSPSPSPISIEKVLQAAKEAATRDSGADGETTTATTTTSSTTPSTTTRPSTTPGICSNDCALLGSIRLTGGVKWVPELTEHNTKEYKNLANEVQHQLEIVFQSSEVLSRWYKMITIDSFSRGSVVVDFIVELSDLGRTVNTADMRRLFHDTLIQETITSDTFVSSNSSDYRNLKLGKFTVDSSYTDFSVIQKTAAPVRVIESDMLLPQWAIAVIVIGLASLLFVLIFGITVVISRHKNSKKHPTALTEEMLNELNKSHMGGFENYAADDLYNMEDVWNEKPFKKRSSYYQDGSMPNIYDSWRSDWNGYYGNSYYNGSIRSGYSRRRSDYDTNF